MTEPLSAVAPDGSVLGDEREIPDGILALLGRSASGCTVRSLSSTSCTLYAWDSDHEFRFQMRTDGVWEWDEIVGRFWVHLEQMGDKHYWMGLHPLGEDGKEAPGSERGADGPDRVCVDFIARKRGLRLTGWMD